MSQSPKDIAERIINEPLRASLSPAHQIVDLARAYLELVNEYQGLDETYEAVKKMRDKAESEIAKLKEENEYLKNCTRDLRSDVEKQLTEEIERLKQDLKDMKPWPDDYRELVMQNEALLKENKELKEPSLVLGPKYYEDVKERLERLKNGR